uniref:Pectinesterase n=1 Tax=Linum usitatissimum TaxID=4006 RepID=Q94FS5_LINUS|nr:putative pectin methylesterase LuPME5 [Linum usitatissimum]
MAWSESNRTKNIFLLLTFSAAILITATTATVHHPVIKSSCSTTLYPELCHSAASASAAVLSDIKTTTDVVDLSLNATIAAVQANNQAIKKIISSRSLSLTKREKAALADCIELCGETMDEPVKTIEELHGKKKSAAERGEDLKTLLSAAMTNQETCLDGFSHDKGDKKVRELLAAGQTNVGRMCSNSLAMVENITEEEVFREGKTASFLSEGRKMGEEEDGWPRWISAGDRRLLQAGTVTPNVVVAADGSGNFRTVSQAVAAAPEGSTSRYVIRIKAGVYRETLVVPKKKTNLMFVGDGRTSTIITGSMNVVDGSTTFNSATVAVVGDRFMARDLTFQNTAGPSKHQAVALRVNADFTAFYRCDMLAYQDTLYVHSLRQFYVSCFIAGTVDFIFGNAAVVLQNCDIHARRPNSGQRNMVTAQGRDDPNQNTGIVIQKCRIGATQDLLQVQSSVESYLGRPWKMYSRTVIMQTDISNVIRPAGWFMWDGNFALATLTYREYANTGAGSGTSGRVRWGGYKVITSASEAQPFAPRSFIGGASWLPATGFPFSLDL